MKYFDTYTSNTAASTQNQHTFHSDGEISAGRVYYKVSKGGEFNYSLLFSNTVDSTFGNGGQSHANEVCDPWVIRSAKIGRCKGDIDHASVEFCTVTFGGNAEKHVSPGEFFATDPVKLQFDSGDYLCFEMTFSGTLLPYHEEVIIPVFRKSDGEWISDKRMPLPGIVGCDRPVTKRISYIGDSITQGIGTAYDSYTHWNAVLSEMIGYDGISHYNCGIGCARAQDTASGGAWFYKAKRCDIAVVCIGTNDLMQRLPEEGLRRDIIQTVELLLSEGITVVLQTVPPFELYEDRIPVWERLNRMICRELADKVALVFDVGEAIGQKGAPYVPIYGGHPNAEGCRIWAEKLYFAMKNNGII